VGLIRGHKTLSIFRSTTLKITTDARFSSLWGLNSLFGAFDQGEKFPSGGGDLWAIEPAGYILERVVRDSPFA
jgi:hypothetical protein